MRRQFIIAAICLTSLTGCLSPKNNKLNTDEVKQIEILKRGEDEYKLVAKDDYSNFTEAWNKSTYIGLTKFYPEYKIKVTLKNNSIVDYRVSGSSVKEKNDSTYAVNDKSIFNTMWNKAGSK